MIFVDEVVSYTGYGRSVITSKRVRIVQRTGSAPEETVWILVGKAIYVQTGFISLQYRGIIAIRAILGNDFTAFTVRVTLEASAHRRRLDQGIANLT